MSTLPACIAAEHFPLESEDACDCGHVFSDPDIWEDEYTRHIAAVSAEAALREAAEAYWQDTTITRRPEHHDWLRDRADRIGSMGGESRCRMSTQP